MEITEITTQEPSTELALQDRAAVALNSSKTEAQLREMAAKYTHITAVVDKAGRDQAHGAGMELKRARTTIEKVAKDARDDATKFSKAVIAEAARLVAITEAEETRLLALRDEWDAKAEAERQAKAAAERARVLAITKKISDITAYQVLAAGCRTSDQVLALQVQLNTMHEGQDLGAVYQEFSEEAKEAIQIAHTALTDAYNTRLAEEKAEQERREAAEAERKRIEEARALLAAEQAAARAESERREADARADADKARQELEAERAAIQAEREALRAQQEALRATLADPEPAAVAAPVEPEPITEVQAEPAAPAVVLDAQQPQMPTAKQYAAGLLEDCTTLLNTLYGMTRADAVDILRCAAAELSKE